MSWHVQHFGNCILLPFACRFLVQGACNGITLARCDHDCIVEGKWAIWVLSNDTEMAWICFSREDTLSLTFEQDLADKFDTRIWLWIVLSTQCIRQFSTNVSSHICISVSIGACIANVVATLPLGRRQIDLFLTLATQCSIFHLKTFLQTKPLYCINSFCLLFPFSQNVRMEM